jgi:ferric iron reductase protein FhuF
MIAGVTVGDYDCFAGHIVGRDDSRPAVDAADLLNADMQAAIAARFARRFGSFEPRAVHSIWMKWYLNAFLPPVLLADVLLARGLPLTLEATRFILADDSRIAAVTIDGEIRDTADLDPFARFETLMFAHFEPLIEIFTARTDVTHRVYWSNVGNTFEAMLRRIELVSGMSPRLEQARRLLNTPFWPDGRVNPIHDAVYDICEGGEMVRLRRVCCLQYLLPDRRFCKACPINEARTANAGVSC